DWIALSQAPGISDAAGLLADARMYQTNPESRGLLNYGLTALGILPLVPSASQIRKFVPGGEERLVDRGLSKVQANRMDDGYADYGVMSQNGLNRGFLSTKRDKDLAGNEYMISMDSRVDPSYQRQGVATDLYDAVEQMEGIPFAPDANLTAEGAAFWATRNPEMLKGLLDTGEYFSEGTESIVRGALQKAPSAGTPQKSYASWTTMADDIEEYDDYGYFVDVTKGPEYAVIDKIYVDPSERGRGKARSLLREAIAEIQSERPGIPIMLNALPLEPGTDMNRLVSFYESEGFSELPVRPGMDFIPMQLTGKPKTPKTKQGNN
ncbi:MAG: GNAT family N-acetyltransferase, partial [Opitutae bacterium]